MFAYCTTIMAEALGKGLFETVKHRESAKLIYDVKECLY
jgi:hypothetical protein